jgi:hypothetical protein
MPLSTCENVWLQRLVLHQSPHELFPFRFFCVEEVLLAMVKKTMDHHVLPNLALAIVVYASFGLWMSRGGVNTFALVINFLNDNWVPMHISVTNVKFKHLICSPLHILYVNTYVNFIAKIMNNKHIVILSMSWPPSSTNYSFSLIFVHQVGSYSNYAPSKLFQWIVSSCYFMLKCSF